MHIFPQALFNIRGSVFAEKPQKDIYNFIGRFTMVTRMAQYLHIYTVTISLSIACLYLTLVGWSWRGCEGRSPQCWEYSVGQYCPGFRSVRDFWLHSSIWSQIKGANSWASLYCNGRILMAFGTAECPVYWSALIQCALHCYLCKNRPTDLPYIIGTATGVVIYTGRETRSSMNTSTPRSKV